MGPVIRMLAHVFAALACAVAAVPAHASRAPTPPVNPKTYVSPSGRYQLLVDPSDRDGRGPADYRLTLEGATVWSATLAYTLFDAAVTDDGTAAGYGYTLGILGFPPADQLKQLDRKLDEHGDLVVAILAPDGKPRLEHRVPRRQSRMLHADPVPEAMGMFADVENDRLVVRINEDDGGDEERWHAYRLSTGAHDEAIDPKAAAGDGAMRSVDARPVPGTGLTLVQWWLYKDEKAGARFTLMAPDGTMIWSLDRIGDYDLRKQRDPQRHGIVGVRHGEFDLRFVRDEEQVTFAVVNEAGVWKISERRRQAFIDPEDKPATQPAIETVHLKSLGTLTLGAAPTTQPVRGDIRHLRIDAGGRIGLIRMEDHGTETLVFVRAADGALVREVRIDGFRDAKVSSTTLTPLLGDRWLATSSGFGPDATARGWWVDAASGAVEAIDPTIFAPPPIEAADGTGDGGFVALTNVQDRLICFNERGGLRWQVAADNSPRDVAVTRGGGVALLTGIPAKIRFFNVDGQPLRTLDLAQAFGRKPNYPVALSHDAEGGLLVHDFRGEPSITRLAADGTRRGAFTPRFADGQPFQMRGGGVRVAPDGGMWASDGECLTRADDKGVVRQVLGEPPRPGRLAEVTAATIDRDGRICAVAARTGAVHVLDRDGKPVMICQPAPNDFASNAKPELITTDGDGNLYVASGFGGPTTYVKFDRTGTRVGTVAVTEDSINGAWIYQPGTQQRWARGYRDVYLTGADGQVKRTLSRRADRTWLDVVDEIAVAPDGGLAVATTHTLGYDSPPAVTLFTPAGDPLRTFPLPDGNVFALGYDGHRVYVSSIAGVYLIRADTGRTTLFAPPRHRPNRGVWQPLSGAPDGQLWLLERGGNRIERFHLPTDES